VYLQPLLRNMAPKATEFAEITQTTQLLRRSSSFKVNDFSSNRKPICDFLLVLILTLRPTGTVSKLWPIIYWSNYRSIVHIIQTIPFSVC